jgi:hypothetical protein
MDSEPHSVVIGRHYGFRTPQCGNGVKNGGKVQKVQNERKESTESAERKEGKTRLKGDKARLKVDEDQLEEPIINLAFHRAWYFTGRQT